MTINEQKNILNRDHLIKTGDSNWDYWRTLVLRSTGFPHHLVLELAIKNTYEKFIEFCELLKNNGIDPELFFTKETYKNLAKSDVFDDLEISINNKLDELSNSYKQESDFISKKICELVKDDRFCRAVITQNLTAYCQGILPLRDGDRLRNRKWNKREELFAKYLQRYCLKNDTIGFFGPVIWGNFVENSGLISSSLLPMHPQICKFFFEQWAVDAIAERVSSMPSVRHWACPRKVSTVLLTPSYVLTTKGQYPISKEEYLILALCNGKLNFFQILNSLNNHNGDWCENKVTKILEKFVQDKIIVWGFEVRVSAESENELLSLLESIGDKQLRYQAVTILTDLINQKNNLCNANNSESLQNLLEHLNNSFKTYTTVEPQHLSGQIYAGRTIVYEECCTNIDLKIGNDFINSFSPIGSILLTSSRWLTYKASLVYLGDFNDIYQELVTKHGMERIWFPEFWELAEERLFANITADPSGKMEEIITEFQRKWAELIQFEKNVGLVKINSKDIFQSVEKAFFAPHSGWQAACYHSPDVMVRIKHSQDPEQGNYELILGEIHPGSNTIRLDADLSMHPDSDQLRTFSKRDFPKPRVSIIEDKDWDQFTKRLRIALYSDIDHRISVSSSPYSRNEIVFNISDLYITRNNGELIVANDDNSFNHHLLDVFGDTISNVILHYFKMFPKYKHIPRIKIDNVVIKRETWNFNCQTIDFVHITDPLLRFLSCLYWKEKNKLPRFVFFKLPKEPKPIYLDFLSPVYVNIFASMIRTSKNQNDSFISLTEMLPTHDELWLTDANGAKYCSEFRFVAIDNRRDVS